MGLQIIKGLILAGAISTLTACGGDEAMKGDESGTQPPDSQSQSGVSTIGSESSTTNTFQGNAIDDPASLLSTRIIYFAYDSDQIAPGDQPIVEAHGSYLASNPGASITLEGHADERGSREYNIALGERRANAVRQLMTLMGANSAQIRVVSYGEERPQNEDHDELAWSQNRRVVVVYRDIN